VIAEHSHDDGALSLIHHVRAERLFLRHAHYSNMIDGRYTTSSRVDSHTLLVSTTISSTTNHRSLLAHHLRGLNQDSANNATNESVYVSSDTEKGALTAGTIISILLCILIVVLFIWLGYCACWFSHGGYVVHRCILFCILILYLSLTYCLSIYSPNFDYYHLHFYFSYQISRN
jgi:hypothetical protein